ncbi:Hcp family type VI secretion system effector [Microlunatus parietis]|uniref:Type VI secretion system secreted protein Hcp n=1 Tax=Microlunatus parietis TaxID=682979 RepID=A0A7Y9IBA6_9ACTN|nr:type VI secretion system tube protein Hcp [Microlunatus parietis]NYE73766.1 type VI secretion system secreted protein Hcp [Microlunatus parietis]
MRTTEQIERPTTTWPAWLVVIALTVLAIGINLPSAATADPGGVASPKALPEPGEPASIQAALEIDGIKGESTAGGHVDAIDVLSWSWGVSVNAPSNPTRPVIGRPTFTDITFSVATSKASPTLMLTCAQGKHLKSAVLYVWKTTREGEQHEFFKITLTDVLITSFQQSGSEGMQLTEQFTLSFAQIVMEYRVQKADGSLGETIRSGWDIARNRAI